MSLETSEVSEVREKVAHAAPEQQLNLLAISQGAKIENSNLVAYAQGSNQELRTQNGLEVSQKEPEGPKPLDGPYDPSVPTSRDGSKPGDGKTPPRPERRSQQDMQSSLDNGLNQNLYAQRRNDEDYIRERERVQEAIPQGYRRGMEKSGQNAEEVLRHTGQIRVREGGGPVFGNPSARPDDRNAPAGIYRGPGRDVTIVKPDGRLW